MNNNQITKFEKQADGTIQLTIPLSKNDINQAKDQIILEFSQTATIPGFRTGKAPLNLVEEKIDPDKLREEILKKLLPQAYSKAVQEHNIKPIMNPKIHINKLSTDEDWEFTALTCEEPMIELGDYKSSVKTVTSKSKIIIPGKEEKKPATEEIMKAILDETKGNIPQILVEQEADKLLAQLLNEIKKLGLNLDQYLASTNRTAESLREEYSKRAKQDIMLEFALHKISTLEKITVEPKEIEEAVNQVQDPDEKAKLEANRYMLTAILKQQKTIDFLMNL